MADYLASINIGIRHIEAIETKQLAFYEGLSATPLPVFTGTQAPASNPSNPTTATTAAASVFDNHFTINVNAPEGSDPKEIARLVAEEVNKILGDQLATSQLQAGNPLKPA